MGYFKDDELTRRTIDDEGFIHSGDVGRIDKKGNLTITGRLKEIITSGGENIAPVFIENEIKNQLNFLSNVVVIGDGRKYIVAIMTLKHAVDDKGRIEENKLADQVISSFRAMGSQARTVDEARNDPIVIKMVEEGIKKANDNATSRTHNVRKWAIIDRDFSVQTGELTPNFKLRRAEIRKRNEITIEKLYEEPKL